MGAHSEWSRTTDATVWFGSSMVLRPIVGTPRAVGADFGQAAEYDRCSLPYPIVHEDAAVLAIDKPEGIATIPERPTGEAVEASVWRTLEAERGEKLFVVHRLDKEVSGLLVFARTAAAHRTLSLAFERRAVDKTYLAVAHGAIDRDVDVDRPIAQFGSGRMGVHERRGKPSRTTFRVVERAPRYTLLEATPHTGRRHQIRVHAYAIGHALVGDVRYGDRALQARYPRLMLHGHRLRVATEDVTLDLICPPSASFRAALSALWSE